MVLIGRSAKLYQELKEPTHRTTRRGPGPRHSVELNAANTLELTRPLPTPNVLHAQDNKPPESGATTKPGPYGNEEEELIV